MRNTEKASWEAISFFSQEQGHIRDGDGNVKSCYNGLVRKGLTLQFIIIGLVIYRFYLLNQLMTGT